MIGIPKWLADFGLRLNRRYYERRLKSVYFTDRPPSWFDHRIDLHYLWPQNLFWLERGIWPRKYMTEGCGVLDLFCGDGFYSRYFYSTIAGHIDAVDRDPTAITHATRWHSHPSIDFVAADAVTQDFPRPHYDVIVWYEAIEHLAPADYAVVVSRIKAAMGAGGVLIGSTPLVPESQQGKGNWEHQNEFAAVPALTEFLRKDFADVQVDVTVWPAWGGGQRRTAHFVARAPR
jgi:SAM-dependent methyltransferase